MSAFADGRSRTSSPPTSDPPTDGAGAVEEGVASKEHNTTVCLCIHHATSNPTMGGGGRCGIQGTQLHQGAGLDYWTH